MIEVAKIHLNKKQQVFCNSPARFPAFVGGWGCGKTMCGILRGVLLSETYKDNLGLIVRKKFTDLRDSTLKDFERYTGMTVKKDSKEVRLPNNSVIMFRHGEELSGLQNVNLGWFMMEQGEEFDTAEQFDLLRGRLRRQESGLRQGMVIANTAGHNWIWDRWKNRQLDGYELTEANIDDNREHLPADTLADWERIRIESPRKYNRYVLNSWEDYELEGAYYSTLMSDALSSKRIETIAYDPYAPVYTFWDLGIGDTTAIWFTQFIGNEIHLIDHYENSGEGLAHYAKIIQSKPYVYGGHYAPHDANSKTLQTGKSVVQIARMMGLEFYVIERHAIETRIETTRGILPKCWFDAAKCARGIDALNTYKKKKNDVLSTDERPVFSDTPLHDWASNSADAFGYMAYAYRYCPIGGKLIGSTQTSGPDYHVQQQEEVDLLAL
jgi:hypothetical protein